jgi:phage-related minor tail protein
MAETLLDTLVLNVRADTRGIERDLGGLRTTLVDGLGSGMEAAGRRMEGALERFVRTGKLSFGSLKELALSVLADIAMAALRANLPVILSGQGGGLGGLLGGVLGGLMGLPGRATGGPVEAGRPYWVGERGPELFVPPQAGRIEPTDRGSRRPVSIAITINHSGAADAGTMARSATQVAASVRAALLRAERDA